MAFQMRGFDLLIFDMDGVLVNTTPCHRQAYQDLWCNIGIEGPPYQTIAGRRTTEVVNEYTAILRPSDKQKSEWVKIKQTQALGYLSTEDITYSDTVTCLSTLAGLGISVALGTSASRGSTEVILRRLRFSKLFPIIVTGDDVSEGKPSPEVYQRVMALAKFGPERTLVIEDSASGLQAGAAANTYIASVRTGEKLDDSRFIGSFSNLDELLRGIGLVIS